MPDDWSVSNYLLIDTNSPAGSINNISADDWYSFFEAHGAVFLPATGQRESITITYASKTGFYWSSTRKDSLYIHQLYIAWGQNYIFGQGTPKWGHAVRLVQYYYPQ